MNPISIQSSATQARTCSICLATSTPRWYKDHDDKTRDRCQSCYQKFRTNLKNYCFTCKKDIRNYTKNFKDQDDKTKNVCRSCYEKSKKVLKKFCFTCKKTLQSSQWRKDPNDKTKNRCIDCYKKAIKDKGRFCFACEKIINSPVWVKDPNDKKRERCQSCYNRVRYQNKERKKLPSSDEETLLNAGSSLKDFQNIRKKPVSQLSNFCASESSEKDPASQTTNDLKPHSKRKIDNQKNPPNKSQCTTNFSPTDNPLLDSFEFNLDATDLWGPLEEEVLDQF